MLEWADEADGGRGGVADGAHRVRGGAAGFTGPVTQAVHGVTATAGGFVAVGDDANAERRVAVSWTSADGITRRQEPVNDMTVTGGVSTAGVTASAVSGSGPVAAVGGSSSLQLWTSPDGRRWTPEQPPAARLAADGARVASDGRAHLVAGGGPALWLRAAGGTWVDVGSDRTVFPRPARSYSLRDLVRAGDRYVATGSDSGNVAVWLSPDGLHWSRREDPDGLFTSSQVDALTARDGLVVAAGAGPSTGPYLAGVAAIWLSDDGGDSWRRIDPRATRPSRSGGTPRSSASPPAMPASSPSG